MHADASNGPAAGQRRPTRAPCGSTRCCARSWPRSSSGWPTPTSGCGWSPSPRWTPRPTCATADVYVGTLADDAAEALEERRAQLQRGGRAPGAHEAHAALAFAADPGRRAGQRVEEVLRRLRRRAATGAEPAPATEGRPGEPRSSAVPTAPGLVVVDKEAGLDLPRRGGPVRGASSASAGWATPAPSTPTPPGVLLVGLGRATRLLRFLTAADKTYTGEVVLGHGHPHPRRLGRGGRHLGHVRRSPLTEVAGGRRRADRGDRAGPPDGLGGQGRTAGGSTTLARAGHGGRAGAPRRSRVQPLRRGARPTSPGVCRIEVTCSSGTYVRVLAADLGTALGGGAHLRNLRRTRGGLVHRRPRPGRWPSLGPATVLTPAEALRDLEAVERGRRGGPAGRPRPAPRPGAARGHRRRPLGPARRARAACWPSTRRPTPTASGRRWCWRVVRRRRPGRPC